MSNGIVDGESSVPAVQLQILQVQMSLMFHVMAQDHVGKMSSAILEKTFGQSDYVT